MRDHPRGEALLSCARKILRDKVLPSLQPELRHELLMVMNAMSVAERQLRYGDQPEQVEQQTLAKLLGEATDTTGNLLKSNRRLSRLIREGAGDPDQPRHRELLAHLRTVGRQRLLESNPKALGQS